MRDQRFPHSSAPPSHGRCGLISYLLFLSIPISVTGQTAWTLSDLIAGGPGAIDMLVQNRRPVPVSPQDKALVLRSLPAEGEVQNLTPAAQQKLSVARRVLVEAGRDGVYEIKVIDVPQAAVGLHARAVLLISEPALDLLAADEVEALLAHEIGHEYIWEEHERARRAEDRARLRELELVCDAIAVTLLRRVGGSPARLISALEKLSRFNRNRFGTAVNERNYPPLSERRKTIHAIMARTATAGG